MKLIKTLLIFLIFFNYNFVFADGGKAYEAGGNYCEYDKVMRSGCNLTNSINMKLPHEGNSVSGGVSGGVDKYLSGVKDGISQIQSIIGILGWFVTIFILLLGAVAGVNLYQGYVVVKEAKDELNEIKTQMIEIKNEKNNYQKAVEDAKISADKIKSETINELKKESSARVDEIVRSAYKIHHLPGYIEDIMAELKMDNPDENKIYPKVTAMFGYHDRDIILVFIECIKKLPKDSDTVDEILKRGLIGFAGVPGVSHPM